MSSPSPLRFQVDLAGIITVLSEHLYSTPTVAFRELLQNGVDAITARALIEPGHEGGISLELVGDESSPTLVVEDNGIGLTEEEVHRFLATIGGSSKRGPAQGRETFLGQFGIGLLSCFVLSDEIVLITRSASQPASPASEWRGSSDGTYSVRTLEKDCPPGTRIYLKIKPAQAALCSPASLVRWLRHYGEFLPVRIELRTPLGTHPVSRESAPWGQAGRTPAMDQREIWETGQRFFPQQCLDLVPLRSDAGGVEGVAFIAAHPRALQARAHCRLYLKGMLLSEKTEGLAPDWAVFCHILANTTRLAPTASRESLMEGPTLERTRAEIGACLISYLQRLSVSDPGRLARIIAIHTLALKSLALENEEVLRFIAPFFEFETSLGRMTFSELRRHPEPQYCVSLERYRQLAPVASAEGRCLINAGYVFDADLIAALAEAFPETSLEAVSAMGFSDQLGEVPAALAARFEPLVEVANETLKQWQCRVEARGFRPSTLPVLYVQNDANHTRRTLDQAREVADDFFGALLDDISSRVASDAYHICYLNITNPLVQKLATVNDADRLRVVIEVLYLQALLLGQYPLSARETKLLSDDLVRLIDLGL